MPGYDQDIKQNTHFLKIEAGTPHDVRLLNPEPIEIYTHQLPAPNKPVRCTDPENCPLCESGSERRQRFLTNAYDYNDAKVMIWEYGTMIAKQLKEVYLTLKEENRKITDVDLKVTATGNQLTKRYQITPRGASKTVPAGLKLHDLIGDGRVYETGEDIPF